jgi:hypothetical protein
VIALNKIASLQPYIVIVGAVLTLSDHSNVAAARSALAAAAKDGFEDLAILKRTPRGWKPSL